MRVRAAPAEGAANKALIRTLAAALDVAPSTIELVAGSTSRTKRVLVESDAQALARRWPGLLTRPG